MRIVQLLPRMDDGELAVAAMEFAAELVRQGHESIVISAEGALVSRLTLHGSRHIPLSVHRASWRRPRMVRRLRKLLQTLEADVLHTHGPAASWLGWRAWRKLPEGGRPKLVTAAHEMPQNGLLRGHIRSRALARGEQVLAASQALSGRLQARYPTILREPPAVVYRGVNTREMDSNAPISGHWHQRLLNQFPQLEGRHWLLLPADVGPGQGQQQFLQLLAGLAEKRDDVFGVMIGDAVAGQEKFALKLERQAADMGLSDKVLFLGRRRDMREFYATARITFAFSDQAGGRSVAQALAMGCPVISCDGGIGNELTRCCFPRGACDGYDPEQVEALTLDILRSADPVSFSGFSLRDVTARTLALYQEQPA